MNWKSHIAELWNVPSRLGERLSWNWLTYNPGVFLEIDLVAKRNAPLFTRALVSIFGDTCNTFIDLGCGTGRYVRALEKQGKRAKGFEYGRLPRLIAATRGIQVSKVDFSRESPLSGVARADLAFSLEVAEHVPVQFADRIVDTLCGLSNRVVFTAAQPHQRGHGHINCQDRAYWITRFESRGHLLDHPNQARLLDKLSREPRVSSFLKTNLMVFGRPD